MNKYKITDNISNIMRSSREKSNKSQDYMAKSLGVSKKTVQNIEAGIVPIKIQTVFEWFDALSMPIMPSLFQELYGEDMTEEEKIDKEIRGYLDTCPAHTKKIIHYLIFGNHGSQPESVMEMVNANLHCPLRARLNIAGNIVINYEVAEALGELVEPDRVPANIELVKISVEEGTKSVKSRKASYNIME